MPDPRALDCTVLLLSPWKGLVRDWATNSSSNQQLGGSSGSSQQTGQNDKGLHN